MSISISVKTELQEDWAVSSPVNFSASSSGVALTTDDNGDVTAFYISGSTIFSAFRGTQIDGNAINTWSIEDTHFRGSIFFELI
jgi:hypothetical protein